MSIGGGSLEEYVRLTGALQGQPGVRGIEVDLSGPDEELERPMLGAHADRVSEVVGAVARMSLVPVFAKVPGGIDVVPIAIASARAGATGLTLTGSPPAFVVDASSMRPTLGGGSGWLSGPCLKPLTLRAIADVVRALPRMPLVASGGIATSHDAIEAIIAGATAVQVGVAALIDPTAPVSIAQGIAAELKRRSLLSPMQLRGANPTAEATTHVIPRPDQPLIVALDVSDLDDAERLATALAPEVGMLKVGFELFWAHGPEAVRRMTPHGPVFMDSKLHDIPTTVEHASANIARLGVRMFNVHALGGEAMMRAALEGAKRGADAAGVAMPLVIAVTVLSSQAGDDLASPASLAWEAKAAGLDGVVVSGAGRARRPRGMRRRVLSGRAGHPSRGHERSRSGACADAARCDRAGRGLPRGRSRDHHRGRSRRRRARDPARGSLKPAGHTVRRRFVRCRMPCVYSPRSRTFHRS